MRRRLRGWSAVNVGNDRRTEKLLEAQPNQVGRAGILHHAEGDREIRQERRQPRSSRGDMHECGRVNAQNRNEAST